MVSNSLGLTRSLGQNKNHSPETNMLESWAPVWADDRSTWMGEGEERGVMGRPKEWTIYCGGDGRRPVIVRQVGGAAPSTREILRVLPLVLAAVTLLLVLVRCWWA